MRALPSVLVSLIVSSLALACSREASSLADDQQIVEVEPRTPSFAAPSEPTERALPPTETAASPASTSGELEAPGELDEPSTALQPDSPAPVVPTKPAPGSAQADAELTELLDESTLTQEEFDEAFRGGGGPNIEGDQFVFGPNERPRGRPRVDVGSPTVTGAAVSPSSLADLVRGSQRDLDGCYALALGKDPSVEGAVSLGLSFDADGDAASAKIEGSSPLGAALDACLVSVAEQWHLRAAAGATVRVPLKLSTAANEP